MTPGREKLFENFALELTGGTSQWAILRVLIGTPAVSGAVMWNARVREMSNTMCRNRVRAKNVEVLMAVNGVPRGESDGDRPPTTRFCSLESTTN